jgi:hypothetical protein
MKNYLLALSILSCFILTGCSAGYVSSRPVDVTYSRPVSPGSGYVWTDGEWEYTGEIITGAKVHGNMPEKVITGNQGIGKTAAKDTSGIRVAGRNNIPAS